MRLLEITVWHRDALACSDCGAMLQFSISCRAEVMAIPGVPDGVKTVQQANGKMWTGMTYRNVQVLRPVCDKCVRTSKYREATYE